MGSSRYGPDAPRPYRPHHLISAQESPVPLRQFQMAPRLKFLMSSEKKEPRYIILFCQISSSFPDGAPNDGDTRIQGIFTCLNKSVTSTLIHIL
jgi:hypothetical protein